MHNSEELLFDALVKHFESQRLEALGVLTKALSFNETIPPDLMERLVKYTKQLSDADACLATLQKYFTES